MARPTKPSPSLFRPSAPASFAISSLVVCRDGREGEIWSLHADMAKVKFKPKAPAEYILFTDMQTKGASK